MLIFISYSALNSQVKMLTNGKEYHKIARIIVDSNLYDLDILDTIDNDIKIRQYSKIKLSAFVYRIEKKNDIQLYFTRSTSVHFSYNLIIVLFKNGSISIYGQNKAKIINDLISLRRIFMKYNIPYKTQGFCFSKLLSHLN